MNTFETQVIVLLALNLTVGIFIAVRSIRAKPLNSGMTDLHAMYFAESVNQDEFFKKKNIVRIKCQLLQNGVPVGQPFVQAEHVTEVLDKEKINVLLNEFAKPLVEHGVKTTIKSFIG